MFRAFDFLFFGICQAQLIERTAKILAEPIGLNYTYLSIRCDQSAEEKSNVLKFTYVSTLGTNAACHKRSKLQSDKLIGDLQKRRIRNSYLSGLSLTAEHICKSNYVGNISRVLNPDGIRKRDRSETTTP